VSGKHVGCRRRGGFGDDLSDADRNADNVTIAENSAPAGSVCGFYTSALHLRYVIVANSRRGQLCGGTSAT